MSTDANWFSILKRLREPSAKGQRVRDAIAGDILDLLSQPPPPSETPAPAPAADAQEPEHDTLQAIFLYIADKAVRLPQLEGEIARHTALTVSEASAFLHDLLQFASLAGAPDKVTDQIKHTLKHVDAAMHKYNATSDA